MSIQYGHVAAQPRERVFRERRGLDEAPRRTVGARPGGSWKAFAGDAPELRLYHATWCGHCKKLMPKWHDVESMMGGSMDVVERDVDKFPVETAAFGVTGYPTILYVDKQRGRVTKYGGKREASSILDWSRGLREESNKP